jgi:sec-independent protein translocase protein TatC
MKDTTTEAGTESGRPEPEAESGKMSFLEHLDELRRRLVRIVTYLGIGFAVCFYFCKGIYRFISVPITKALPANGHLVYTNPTDPFTMYIKVALIAGVFLTIPFSLYEVWKFIAPGLYRKEKKYVIPFMVSSVFLFLAGGAFCYYFVLNPAYTILLQIGSEFTPMISINEYLDLTLMMILGFGLIFEMPVIIAFLAMFGLVSASFLWRKSKYSIVIMVTIAAILSPTGDAVNLLIWSAPMIVLYFISIGVAALFGWQRKKKGKFSLWD